MFRYVWWVGYTAVREKSIRALIRNLSIPRCLFSTPEEILHAIAIAQSLGLRNGWIRWDTNGSRRQLFAPWLGRVCKWSKPGALLSIKDELEYRAVVGNSSPKILEYCKESNAYVEEWVDTTPSGCTNEDLLCVSRLLASNFYQVEQQPIECYLSTAGAEFSEQARRLIPRLAIRLGLSSLPVSLVHGDLWCSNIALRRDGSLILFDWEYCRKCVVTQDAWFFLYRRSISRKGILKSTSFLEEFRESIQWVLPNVTDVGALHLIHLFEREALLIRNSTFVDCASALRIVQTDIASALRALGCDL